MYIPNKEVKNMQKHTIKRKDTNKFSEIVIEYLENPKTFEKFIQNTPSLENFKNLISLKSENYNDKNRKVITKSLKNQYLNADLLTPKNEALINKLEDSSTYTVTTGHQLSVYTGPLFFIYKILHTIRLAELLKEKYPENNFIPVYWMASEDHDFEEIRSMEVFGSTFSWESEQAGAVGKFHLKDFDSLKDPILERFEGEENILQFIKKHYAKSDNLATATFKLVEELFKNENLLILDADQKELKAHFSSVIKKELFEKFSYPKVETQSDELIKLGYKKQVTPREINLFYIDEKGRRERIIQNDKGQFELINKTCSKEEIEQLVDKFPERFSPNVVLRPVYQEYILPNLAYIGGGGEISYWLQLKGVFDELNLTFPILQIRNSIQIIDKTSNKKLEKLDFKWQDIFKEVSALKKDYLLNHQEEELNFEEMEKTSIELKRKINNTIEKVDKGLVGYGKSEITKLEKQVENIKSKLIRHKKKQEETSMKQIESLIERLFPSNELQERKHNIIQYIVKHDRESFLKDLKSHISPFDKDLIVLIEE